MQNVSCFFCQHCKRETHFVPIHKAIRITGVSRSTIYYWIDKEWVHWVQLPNLRRVICEESLHCRQSEPIGLPTKGAAA
jgi:hypothetical protein